MIGSEMLKKGNIKKENIKICFTASSGGHLEEISRLNIIKSKYNSFLITEKNSFEELEFCNKNYYLPQINRKELLFIFKFIYIFGRHEQIDCRPLCCQLLSTDFIFTNHNALFTLTSQVLNRN